MIKTNEEVYKMAIDFLVNSKHGSDEETLVMIEEIKSLNFDQSIQYFGVMSGLICSLMDFANMGHLTEPLLREFFNQRYLQLKKDGAFS